MRRLAWLGRAGLAIALVGSGALAPAEEPAPAAGAAPVEAAPPPAGPMAAGAPKAADRAVPADVAREARAAAQGREPAALQHGDFVSVPYGHQVPVLRCAVLRVCLIELEEGETVLNTVTGDSVRWILDRAMAGPKGLTAILAVKPTECNVTTNLAITTTRRIYQVTLDAPCKGEEGENPKEPYTRLLRFYYPDELVRRWASEAEAEQDGKRAEERSVTPLAADVTALNFRYEVRRAGKAPFPWLPALVFDDGVHSYIKLPEGGKAQESPVLFLLDGKGGAALLNYALRSGYYITDRVIDRAALVLGSGKDERRLEITNTARGR